jgi:hypothetical protein
MVRVSDPDRKHALETHTLHKLASPDAEDWASYKETASFDEQVVVEDFSE